MTAKALFALAPLALLAACGDPDPAPETATETGGEVSGEVLGGSISDDMIALDQLTSTSPPAEPAASTDGDDSASARSSEPEPESGEAEPASADPAPQIAAPLEE